MSVSTLGCAGSSTQPVARTVAPVVSPPAADDVGRATSVDVADADAAIARLRRTGVAGLDALLGRLSGEHDPASRARIRSAIDRVARQRDAHASRLYWYTELDEAKQVARATGKPILSLRLLGDLGDDLSCANSRFFRTAIYPDARVSAHLRQAFVLHWSSERPAPRITIDMGDGRSIVRTITGNSIHYVLDADGRPIDALPGLYGPKAFLDTLAAAEAAHAASKGMGARDKTELLRSFHAAQRSALSATWNVELARVGARPAQLPAPVASRGASPTAANAAPIAMAKAMVEAPVVAAMSTPVEALPSPIEPAAWQALLARHRADARLDASSRALMREKMGPVDDATFSRRVSEFERVLTEDTVRNEYTLHRILHEWLAMSPAPEDFETLNRRVYASLFLTPSTDPWLGLAPDAYTAIPGEGLRVP